MIEEEELSCTYKNYIYQDKNWEYSVCSAEDHCKHYHYTLCKGVYFKDRVYKMRLSQQCKYLKSSSNSSREEKDTY